MTCLQKMVMKAAKKGKKRALELEVVPKEQPMVEEEVPATRYHQLSPESWPKFWQNKI